LIISTVFHPIDSVISGQLEEKHYFSHGTPGKGRPPIGPASNRHYSDFLFFFCAATTTTFW
jgi:hypothetical protein